MTGRRVIADSSRVSICHRSFNNPQHTNVSLQHRQNYRSSWMSVTLTTLLVNVRSQGFGARLTQRLPHEPRRCSHVRPRLAAPGKRVEYDVLTVPQSTSHSWHHSKTFLSLPTRTWGSISAQRPARAMAVLASACCSQGNEAWRRTPDRQRRLLKMKAHAFDWAGPRSQALPALCRDCQAR
jgi:hypothetical protein